MVSSSKPEKPKRKSEKNNMCSTKETEKEDIKSSEEGMCLFGFSRVRRIAECEDSDMKLTNEALFLIGKATEKFLEKLTKDAHAASVKDHQKSISYKHISNVVHNDKRFAFLSDFVPEMVTAEDALADWKKMKDALDS